MKNKLPVRNYAALGCALLSFFLFGCDAGPQRIQVTEDDAMLYSDPSVSDTISRSVLGNPAITMLGDKAAQARMQWGIDSPQFQALSSSVAGATKGAVEDARKNLIAQGRMVPLAIGTVLEVQDSVSQKLEVGGYEEMYRATVITGTLSGKQGYIDKNSCTAK